MQFCSIQTFRNCFQVMEGQDEKVLCLSDNEMLRALGEQVTAVLCAHPQENKVPLAEFLMAWARVHGPLELSNFAVQTVHELISKIPNVAKVISNLVVLPLMSPLGRSPLQVFRCSLTQLRYW